MKYAHLITVLLLLLLLIAQVTYSHIATAIANRSLSKSVSTYVNHNDATMYR